MLCGCAISIAAAVLLLLFIYLFPNCLRILFPIPLAALQLFLRDPIKPLTKWVIDIWTLLSPFYDASEGPPCLKNSVLLSYVTLHFITTKLDLIYSLEACTSSLGLENGQIRDKQISASSELEKQHAAKQGRVSLSSFPQDRYDIRWRLVPFYGSSLLARAGFKLAKVRSQKKY